MEILNLNNKTLSNGNVIIDHFPDGQINIHLEGLNRKDGMIKIVSSLKNGEDIMLLLMSADVIKRNGITIQELHIPYLYAARMDRVMDFNQPFTLDIIANLINSINANNVFLYEVHNVEKTLSLIKNATSISPLEEYYNTEGEKGSYLLFPDKGAQVRYKNYCVDNYICCKKVRDPQTNKLSGFAFEEFHGDDEVEKIRIIDDLCDGGGTYCGIGKLLKEQFPNAKIELVITHLIQPSAIEKVLSNGINNIITTNSYITEDKISQEYKEKVIIKEI